MVEILADEFNSKQSIKCFPFVQEENSDPADGMALPSEQRSSVVCVAVGVYPKSFLLLKNFFEVRMRLRRLKFDDIEIGQPLCHKWITFHQRHESFL